MILLSFLFFWGGKEGEWSVGGVVVYRTFFSRLVKRLFDFRFVQTNVPLLQSKSLRAGQESQIHPLDGHRGRGRLPV